MLGKNERKIPKKWDRERDRVMGEHGTEVKVYSYHEEGDAAGRTGKQVVSVAKIMFLRSNKSAVRCNLFGVLTQQRKVRITSHVCVQDM